MTEARADPAERERMLRFFSKDWRRSPVRYDAPVEELAKIVTDHPVFRIDPA